MNEALTFSNQLLLKTLDSTTEAIILVDGQGKIRHLNHQAELMFEYSREELHNQFIEILLPEKMREKHADKRDSFIHAPRARPLVSGLSLVGRRKSGDIFEAEISLTPIETSEEQLISAVVRDISQKTTSEPFFRNLLETAPDAMVIIDHGGRISVVNEQTEKMFGYSREQLLGYKIEMLLPDQFRKGHVGHREGFTENPSVRPMGAGRELLGRRSDGSEFPVEISLSPVESGSDTFVSSVIRDVTERRQMEQEIRDAHAEADRANKANTAFLAAASHDLRQPVQALHLLNGALKRTVKDPRALQMIESQDHSLDGMTNLLNSLLDISRLDAGAVTPELEVFSMKRIIDRLSAEFSRQASQKGLKFQVEPSNILVRSDPNLLGEIIQNFVSNAIRYTDKGKVHMKCTVAGDRLCLAVSDTGIGIETEQFDAIFNEFHQCKTPGSNKEGFGLGLAIVRRMADLLEHELMVESTPGEGSCFSIYLPIVNTSDTSSVDQEMAGQREYTKTSGTIILIEDDFAVADAWCMLLEAEGYRVATAQSANGIEAVLDHLEGDPDLIISDFHLLHDTTGVQVVRKIREKTGLEIPAFIVSGDTSKVIDEARKLGNTAIMCKPVSIDQLLDMAKKALSSGRVDE